MKKVGMEARNSVLFVRIKPSTKAALSKLAKEEGIRVAELVSNILEERIKACASNTRKHR